MRTIYVVVNTQGSVGAADWRDDQDDLPSYDVHDRHYGACGVEGCAECLPTFDAHNRPITDSDGHPLSAGEL